MDHPFERRTFRIQYPERARPRLTVGADVLEVVDCCEEGLRFRATHLPLPEPGTVIAGTLAFQSDRQVVEVRGRVVRCQSGEVALHLERPGVPRSILFAEQRFLSRRYPLWVRSTR